MDKPPDDKAVSITFNGMVTEEAAREIAEMLGEIVDENDVVFITPDPRKDG